MKITLSEVSPPLFKEGLTSRSKVADPNTARSAFALQAPRLLHTMLRVKHLEDSLAFYVGLLGMRLLRRRDFVEGRFTLAFVGYGEESDSTVIELTHNWDTRLYVAGTAFGHVAVGVADVYEATRLLQAGGVKLTRTPGPLIGDASEEIAFVQDPDGYKVELIQYRDRQAP
jgi:lactoylglutathione lyase